jgi:5'(3')-deoxyribonucleotidase
MAILHIDLDDTTVDFLNGVCVYHNANIPAEEHVTIHHLTDWHKNGVFIQPHLINEGLYFNLEVKADAVRVLKDLSERHDVKFLTAFPTAQSAKEKVEFVEKHFPFIGVKNTTLTWNKGDIKGDLLLDDSPVFLPTFDGIKVCFDAPYNQGLACDYRVYTWLDFEAVILHLEDKGFIKPKI